MCGKGVTETLTSPTGTLGIGGNITVCNGASLTIKDVTASIESFTATNNFWLAGDLNYRYHVNVTSDSSLHLVDSVLNTSAGAFDADPFLNLTVSGGSVLSLDSSRLSFAGWVYVTGQSTVFLNSSSLTPNSALPFGSAGLVQDSGYAPALMVNGSSSLVTNNATITNYYKNAASDGSALDETFTSGQSLSVANGTYGSLLLPTPSTLVPYTYDTWSHASLPMVVGVTNNFTADVSFTAYGFSTTPVPMTFVKGIDPVSVPIPDSFVSSVLNYQGLQGLLGGIQAAPPTVGVVFSLVTAHTAGSVSATLALTPQFHYNIQVAGTSHLYAVDSRFDVNWVNQTAPGVLPSQSNKLLLEGSSTGDLLNSTALTTYTSGSGNSTEVNAFQVDSFSSYWVYNWIHVTALGSTGSPVAGAALNVFSEVSDPTLAHQADQATNPANFPGYFRNAVNSVAIPAGSSTRYGNTSSSGVALYALATSLVAYNSQPDGLYVDIYNLSFTEMVNKVGGGTAPVQAGVAKDTPQLCAWPYSSLGCALTVIPSVVLPLFTADLRVAEISVVSGFSGTCAPGCSLYEGTSLTASVTVQDFNSFLIAGNAAVPVYIYNVTAGTNISSAPQYLTNSQFGTGSTAVLTFDLTVPFHISQPPLPHLWVVIDPNEVAPENGTMAKSASFNYNAIPAPDVIAPTLQVNDGCTDQQLTIPDSNSCNLVKFEAALVNTGDAKVNVSVVFSWHGAGSQIGGTHLLNLLVGSPTVITQVLALNYTYVTGFLSVHVSSAASSAGPQVNLTAVTPTLYFTDFTSLSLPSHYAPYMVYNRVVPGAGSNVANNSTTRFAIGDAIDVKLNLTNVGGPGEQPVAVLYLLMTGNTGAYWKNVSSTTNLAIPGAATQPVFVNLELSWHVNASTIGSNIGSREFSIVVNYTDSWLYGKTPFSFGTVFNATIAPPVVTVPGFSFDRVTVVQGTPQSLVPSGTLHFESSAGQRANVIIKLFDPSSGILCNAVSQQEANGSTMPSFYLGSTSQPLDPLDSCLSTGTYNVIVDVSYLGNNTWFNVTAGVTLKAATTPTSFFSSIFFLLLLAIIAVAIVVAVLFLLKKFGKGNLVECGECGELIPESAAACPKCGAEFEKGMVRCSRCGSSIPSNSKSCPECSVLLVGHESDPNAVAYTRFSDRYRALGKKELGENYNEGAFWDWWKRQPTYLSFAAWSQQQQPTVRGSAPGNVPTAQQMGGMDASAGAAAPPGARPPQAGAPLQGPPQPQPQEAAPSQQPGMMKVCPSCGKGINESFLLCPFCGAVTR